MRRRSGASLVEVLIALVVFTVSVAAYSSAVASSAQSGAERRAASLAACAARDMVERMRATAPHERFARFNANPADDPGGAGTAPGAAFAVEGLTPLDGDPDGMVGIIEFPVIGAELREDVDDADLGMPRDLNGDTLIDDRNHATNYTILPIRVRVEHQVRGARRTFVLHTELVDWSGGAP